MLIEDLSFKIPPGGIVGVIGPNGVGKTTLFRMITGEDSVDSGVLRIGDTVKLGFVDQSRDTLDGDKRDTLDGDKNVWEEISQGESEIDLGRRKVQSRTYVGAFNFCGPDQHKKVGQLTGGKRNRVHLAKMLRSGSNVLLLDQDSGKAIAFAKAIYHAYWVAVRDMGPVDAVLAVASDLGVDPSAARVATQDAAVKEQLKWETQLAIDRGAFGSPFIFVDDQVCWAHDRMHHIEHHLRYGGI